MYHLHLGVIRVCAIRSVACAGRRRRRRRRWRRYWRLTHLVAAVVDILARTDQQGRTHTSRRRESGCEIPRSGRRRREESVAERGSRAGSRHGIAENCPFDSWLATKKGLRHRASRLRRAIVDGGCRRAWLATPRVERGRKRGGKLALIETGDSSHAHPGGSCKRSTAVKEKERKREKEGKNEARGEAGKAIGIYTYIEKEG